MTRQGPTADKNFPPELIENRPRKSEGQKGPGIVERVKAAKTKKAKAELLKEAKEYKHISPATLRKVEKLARRKGD